MSPWDPLPLRDREWARIPPTCVDTDQLRIGEQSASSDSYAHVIYWAGELFVVAGSALLAEAKERGERWTWVRVLFSVRNLA